MIKTDNKGNIIACITTKEDLDYTNFDKETIKYYEEFLIPSYEELSDKQNKEIERLNNLLKETSQTLSKQTTKAITLKSENERLNKEIERLQKENKKLRLCLGIVSPSRVLLEGKYWEKEDNEEIEKLKSIIKEVREYIENNSLYEQDYDYDYEENLYEYPPNDEQARKDILEILDKGE